MTIQHVTHGRRGVRRLAALIGLLALVATGCNDGADPAADTSPPAAEQDGGDADTDGTSGDDTDASSAGASGDLPDDFPDDLPLPSTSFSVQFVEEQSPGVEVALVVDASVDVVVEDLQRQLEAAAWQVESRSGGTEMSVTSDTYNLSKDGRRMQLGIFGDTSADQTSVIYGYGFDA